MKPLVCMIRVRSQIRVRVVCAITAFMTRMRVMTLVSCQRTQLEYAFARNKSALNVDVSDTEMEYRVGQIKYRFLFFLIFHPRQTFRESRSPMRHCE